MASNKVASAPGGHAGAPAESSMRAGSPPAHAPAHPLVRQATSLGSFDLLKLFELGPDGEPPSIMDVLAQNPDWAEQHADQSLDAGDPGSARPLESSRNPGGGAEPSAADGSLLEEALKLTGPPQLAASHEAAAQQQQLHHHPPQQPQQPQQQLLVTQTSLARLLSAGRSDSLSELVKRPSLTSQLSRDPSFTSAIFNQLLSQKSEDQAMLLSILGLEQVGTPPPPPGSQAAAAARPGPSQPQQQQSQQQLLPRLQVARQSAPALEVGGGQGQGPGSLHAPLLVTPQQQPQPPRVLDSKVIVQRSAGRPPTAPVRPQAAGARNSSGSGGSQPWQLFAPQAASTAARPPAAAAAPADNRSLEQRVGSLDYMLDAGKALPGAGARGSQAAAGQTPGSISFRLPPGGVQQAAALWRAPAAAAAPATPGSGGRAAGAARPQTAPAGPRYQGTVIQTPQQRAAAGLPSLAIPSTQARVVTGGAAGGAFPAASTPPAGTPVISGLPPRPPPASAASAAPATPALPAAAAVAAAAAAASGPAAGAAAVLASLPQAATPPTAAAGPKSSFLSGLITGIRPPALAAVGPAAASAAAAAVAGLPQPVVAPLPPLPGVPSIAEYQSRLAGGPPGARPRLEVLPLLGTATPQVAPVRLDFSRGQSPAAAAAASPAQSAAAVKAGNGFLKSWLGGGGIRLPASTGLGGSFTTAAAAAAAAANGAAAVRPRAAASTDSASSGSLGGSKRGTKRLRAAAAAAAPAGGKELRARAASGGSAGSRQPSEDADSGGEEGLPAADRRELRKAKNRASAAASRARREAYTASLEEQVARLKAEQAWLKQQVAAQASAAQQQQQSAGARPKRQLSI